MTGTRQLPGARRAARAFTLVEAAIVLLLISIISAASLAWFSTTTSPEGDGAAKTGLASFVSIQEQSYNETGDVKDASQLAVLDYTRTFSDTDPSTGPQEVSVAVSGTIAMAAVNSGGGACWFVRLDLKPSPTSPPLMWYVDTLSGSDTCDAGRITLFPVNDPAATSEGSDPSDPIQL